MKRRAQKKIVTLGNDSFFVELEKDLATARDMTDEEWEAQEQILLKNEANREKRMAPNAVKAMNQAVANVQSDFDECLETAIESNLLEQRAAIEEETAAIKEAIDIIEQGNKEMDAILKEGFEALSSMDAIIADLEESLQIFLDDLATLEV